MKRLLCLFAIAALGVTWAQPVVNPGATGNAADYSREFAPGSVISVFGVDLAPRQQEATTIPLPTSILGTSVEATDGARTILLPLYMVAETQVNAQIPYDMGPDITLRVISALGTSGPDTITVVARAPRLYAWNWGGFGRAVATHRDGTAATRAEPIFPGEFISFWGNSMGEVDPPIEAGAGANDGSEGKPLNTLTGEVTATIFGLTTEVRWGGLAPGLVGLYQVDVFTPYYDEIGDVDVTLGVDGAVNQEITVPIQPNGFYWVVSASKFPNGQTRTAVSGPASAVAWRHEDAGLWGAEGFNAWTGNTGLGAAYSVTSGLALTLKNGDAIVYDNNGIEDGTTNGYYDNSSGAVPDGDAPGLAKFQTQTGNWKSMHATYFRLGSSTTFDQLIAYFDGNGDDLVLPFDPENFYNTWRMNIYSNGGDGMPAANGFTGDVWSSDTAAGSFALSRTSVDRIGNDFGADPIFRVVYTLEQPVTLDAGEYWFASDVRVPEPGAPVQGPATSSITGVHKLGTSQRVTPPSPMTHRR